MSVPEKGWPHAGCIYDDLGRWSVAWRVHDAQFWGATYYDDAGVPIKLGTPQRRRRIALVADFGGLAAPEILFEREGLSGDFEPGGETRQTVAGGAENCLASDDRAGIALDLYNLNVSGDIAVSLTANTGTSATRAGPTVAIPIHDQATRFCGKRGDNCDGKGNGLGVGSVGDPMNTLTGADRHAVCVAPRQQES